MIALPTALQQRADRWDHRIYTWIGEFATVHEMWLIRKRPLLRQRRTAEGGGDAVADINFVGSTYVFTKNAIQPDNIWAKNHRQLSISFFADWKSKRHTHAQTESLWGFVARLFEERWAVFNSYSAILCFYNYDGKYSPTIIFSCAAISEKSRFKLSVFTLILLPLIW